MSVLTLTPAQLPRTGPAAPLNLTGLLTARARWNAEATGKRPVVLCSADSHYSIARAAAIVGLPAEAIIKVRASLEEIGVSGNHELALAALAAVSKEYLDELMESAHDREQRDVDRNTEVQHG